MELDVETIIEFLKAEKGVKLNEMMAKLGVDRGGFLSWRRSSNPGRRKEMAKLLKEHYAEHFTGEETRPDEAGYQEKYVKLLEKNLDEITKERDQLKKEVKELLETIKKALYDKK